MTSDTREILITNDDGIVADGIHVLASIMRRYGNVTVVAPLHAQSGKSAALSLDTKLYLKQIKNEPGYREYTFNGTPVDCIKIGINECWPEGRLPDLVVSGINHGANCSVASLYSGTLGACIEGTVYGIPSIGFSICTHAEHPDFSPITEYADTIRRTSRLQSDNRIRGYDHGTLPRLPSRKRHLPEHQLPSHPRLRDPRHPHGPPGQGNVGQGIRHLH